MQDGKENSGVMSSILAELGVISPDGSSEETMTVEQQEIIAAYRAGRMTELEFQKYLSDDPGLANHLAQVPPRRSRGAFVSVAWTTVQDNHRKSRIHPRPLIRAAVDDDSRRTRCSRLHRRDEVVKIQLRHQSCR